MARVISLMKQAAGQTAGRMRHLISRTLMIALAVAGSSVITGCAERRDCVLHLDQASERDLSAWHQTVRQGNTRSVGSADDADRGKVFSFSGEDAYLRIAKTPSLLLTNGFTISVWFKVDRYATQLPLLEWEGDGFNTHMWLNVPAWCNGGSGVNLCIEGAGGQNVVCIANPESKRWTHMVVTHDVRNRQCSVFIDGELKISRQVPLGPPSTDADLIVGARPAMPNARFRGMLDDIRIYNRALTGDEVRSIH